MKLKAEKTLNGVRKELHKYTHAHRLAIAAAASSTSEAHTHHKTKRGNKSLFFDSQSKYECDSSVGWKERVLSINLYRRKYLIFARVWNFHCWDTPEFSFFPLWKRKYINHIHFHKYCRKHLRSDIFPNKITKILFALNQLVFDKKFLIEFCTRFDKIQATNEKKNSKSKCLDYIVNHQSQSSGDFHFFNSNGRTQNISKWTHFFCLQQKKIEQKKIPKFTNVCICVQAANWISAPFKFYSEINLQQQIKAHLRIFTIQ